MATIPTVLRVPIPTGNFGNNYGVFSVRHASAQRIVVRITLAQRQLIQKAAKMLDMAEAQYVRDSALNTAKAIIRHAEEFHEDDDLRSG